ncbi:MAG: hypothetical protein JJU36_05895 [Phycisphaeraceae bacterium]|nr:hypothetical protein [Phycisphaeraceae bacterium]
MRSLIGLAIGLARVAEKKLTAVRVAAHNLGTSIALLAVGVILAVVAVGLFGAAIYILLAEVMHPAAALAVLGTVVLGMGIICFLAAQVFRDRNPGKA